MPKNLQPHSSIAAAWLFLGREIFPDWPCWPQGMDEARALTGASKSQAYEMVRRLRESIESLQGKPGRPPAPPPQECSALKISRALAAYLLRNNGAATLIGERCHYSDGFRHFVLGLMEPGQPAEGFSVAQLAEATQIPLGTLKEWFVTDPAPEPCSGELCDDLGDSHLRQIVLLYQNWKGTFVHFCRMVREQYRLNYGMTFIGSLLQHAGLRHRKSQKSKQAPWDRNTFRTLFPGAQWLGDGTSIAVQMEWGNESFVFNVEVILDVASNALVGFAVSDFENEEVLLRAYEDATTTAGEVALSLSLDNRSSNHTPVVQEGLDTRTTLLATTLGRGQSKAPLEGTFGLFSQEMPPLHIEGQTTREQARSALELIFTAWARGRNGRPRCKFGQKSPIELYRSARPNGDQIEAAKKWIQALKRRQEQLRRTREARADKAKLELLKQGLAELSILDPSGQLALRLAYYSRDAIVLGLAIFKAKLSQGAIPDDADHGRYLGGIIRNSDEKTEFELISESLIKNRELLKDLSLRTLTTRAEELRSQPLATQVSALIDEALSAHWDIDYQFWATKSVDALAALPADRKINVYRAASRRIAATFTADRHRKQILLSRLAKAATET